MSECSYRPIARGRNWAISTRNALASQAGEIIFFRGGNAIDAAVAALAALGVVEPAMSGIGGELFMLVYDPEKKKVYSVNGGGAAPERATIDFYKNMGFESIPLDGALSGVVPGAFDAWCVALDRFGTMSLSQVLEPAIELAESGFPASEEFVSVIKKNELRLRSFESSRELYFRKDGSFYDTRDNFRNRKLARLYRKLAEKEENALRSGVDRHCAIKAARDSFYKGEVAEEIVSFMQDNGGLFLPEDFACYYALLEEPVHTSYRGYEIYKSPSANQGPAELEILNMLENFDIRGQRSIHICAEAVNLAMADRERFLGDLNYIKSPLNGLLSKEYARHRAKLIDENRRLSSYDAGDPWGYEKEPYVYRQKPYFLSADMPEYRKEQDHEAKCSGPERDHDLSRDMGLTSYACASDKSGLTVSATPSNFSNFGSALVVEPFGFPMNDRASYFWLDEKQTNSLQPGKRPRNTITPSMALKNGKPYLAYGTPGADQQCQALSQILVNIVDLGMSIQEAIDAPMWSSKSFPLSYGNHSTQEGVISIDARDDGVVAELEKKGWLVEVSEPFSNNRACVIRILDDCIEAAAMSTTEGSALAW
jgi:gamma-glutamyltranspeptidase/glutathione hydrolase